MPSCQLASVAAAGCGCQGENGCGDAISIGSASNTGAGTIMICPQAGHLARLPAADSGAESALPHDVQVMLI